MSTLSSSSSLAKAQPVGAVLLLLLLCLALPSSVLGFSASVNSSVSVTWDELQPLFALGIEQVLQMKELQPDGLLQEKAALGFKFCSPQVKLKGDPPLVLTLVSATGEPPRVRVEAVWELGGEYKIPELTGGLKSAGLKVPVKGHLVATCSLDPVTAPTPFGELDLVAHCSVDQNDIEQNVADGIAGDLIQWAVEELTTTKKDELADKLKEVRTDAVRKAVAASPYAALVKDVKVTLATQTVAGDGEKQGVQLQFTADGAAFDVAPVVEYVKASMAAAAAAAQGTPPPPPTPEHEEL